MRLQPLIVPGWQGSGPLHWQTQWQARLPRATRVEQDDWEAPTRSAWVAALTEAIENASRPPLLIAHSLGCITVAHLPLPIRQHIAGALLVAPADVERHGSPPALRDFAPIAATPLPFPSIVVASTDDPYCSLSRAETFAANWGSDLVVVREAGHLNDASGLGDWPEGLRLLTSLRRRACWRVPVATTRIAAMPPVRHG